MNQSTSVLSIVYYVPSIFSCSDFSRSHLYSMEHHTPNQKLNLTRTLQEIDQKAKSHSSHTPRLLQGTNWIFKFLKLTGVAVLIKWFAL